MIEVETVGELGSWDVVILYQPVGKWVDKKDKE